MGHPAVVMVVDDHPDFRWLITHLLCEAGYCCLEECCAEDALKSLRDGLQPDLIVTDLHMVKMSGKDLLAAVRAAEPLQQIPVVLVSNDTRIESIAAEAGFDSFVDKPRLGSELLGTVKLLLGSRSRVKS